jgi:hypothetical protein
LRERWLTDCQGVLGQLLEEALWLAALHVEVERVGGEADEGEDEVYEGPPGRGGY